VAVTVPLWPMVVGGDVRDGPAHAAKLIASAVRSTAMGKRRRRGLGRISVEGRYFLEHRGAPCRECEACTGLHAPVSDVLRPVVLYFEPVWATG